MRDGNPEGDLEAAGVSLDLYVAVHAAKGEGFALEEVLLHEGLDPDSWFRADAAWARRFMESAAGDLALVDEYDRRLLSAQGRFWRSVSPIDGDVEAWLDFIRRWQDAADPPAMLVDLKIRPSDILRIHRRWSERLETDAALRSQVAAALERPPGEIPHLEVAPARLPPPLRDQAARSRSAEPTATKPAAAKQPPPLLHELPETATAPSRANAAAPARPAATTPPEPAAPPTETTPSAEPASTRLTLVAYASLTAELQLFLNERDRIFAKYGLSDPAVREAESAAWSVRLASDDERRELAEQQQHFVQHWRSVGKR
jgi:hypothetical protein